MKNKTIARIKTHKLTDGFGRSKTPKVGTTFRGTSYICDRRKYTVLDGTDWRVASVTESKVTYKNIHKWHEPYIVIAEYI